MPLDVVHLLLSRSEFLLLQSIVEVQEGGVGLAIHGVGEAEASILHIQRLSCEYLHLIEFSHDKFDHFGSTLFESINSILLSIFCKMSNNSLEVSLKHSHGVLLGQGHLLKLVSINDVNDGLSFLVSWSLIISCSKTKC